MGCVCVCVCVYIHKERLDRGRQRDTGSKRQRKGRIGEGEREGDTEESHFPASLLPGLGHKQGQERCKFPLFSFTIIGS